MNARRKFFPAFLLTAACATAILPMTVAAQGSEVIARVGNTDLTSADVDAYLQTLDPAVRQQLSRNHDALEKVLRAHLRERALYAEARAKNWDKRSDVQARIAATTEEVIVGSYLDSVSEPPADFPSDKEVQAAYDQNKDHLMMPRAFRLSEIVIKTAANADPQTIDQASKKAADIARQARAKDADFAALAKANSQDSTAANGGDTGFVAENSLLPQIRTIVAGMTKGEVSDSIRAPGGFVIVQLTDTRPEAVAPLADVAGQIRAQLRKQRQDAAKAAYLDNLMKGTPITINELALGKIGDNLK